MEEQATVELSANEDKFVSAFKNAGGEVGVFSRTLDGARGVADRMSHSVDQAARRVKAALVGLAAATLIWGGTGAKTFSDFETGMANVATVADTTFLSISKAGDAIRDLSASGQITQDVNDLAAGLYDVNSAGIVGAQGIQVLDVASRFATAGLTDTATAVRAITALLNAYGMNASEAAYVSDILFTTVKNGVITAEGFANTIGAWGASAAATGVELNEAAAAMATLTKGGETAERAATSLAAIFRQFIKPSDAMKDSLEEMGFQSGTAAIEALGLKGALDALWDSAGQTASGLGEIIPETEALRGAFTLVNGQAETYAQLNELMADRTQVAGATMEALALQMNTLKAQTQVFMNQFRELRLEVGEILVPLGKLAVGFGSDLLGAFTRLPEPMQKTVAAISLIGPAIAITGGLILAHRIKLLLMEKAVATLVATSSKGMVGSIPIIRRFFIAYGEAGGLIPMIRSFFLNVIRGTNGARAALLRGTIAMTGFTAALVVGFQAFHSFGNEAAKVRREMADATWATDTGRRIREMGLAMEFANQQIAEGARHAEASGLEKLGLVFGGIKQSLDPFDENTIARGLAQYEEGHKLRQELEAIDDIMQDIGAAGEPLFMGMFEGAETLGEWNEQLREFLAQAYEAGEIDLGSLLPAREKINDLLSSDLAYGQDGGLSEEDRALVDAYYASIEALIPALEEWGVETQELAEAQEEAAAEAERLEAIARSEGVEAAKLAAAIATLADETASAADKADAFATALDGLMNRTMNQWSAQARMGEALRDFADLVDDGNFSLDSFTEQGAATISVLEEMAASVMDSAVAAYEQGRGFEGAVAVMQAYIDSLFAMGEELGLSNAQIRLMLQLMGLTPQNLATIVELPGANQAIAQIGTVAGGLNALNGYVAHAGIQITVGVNTRVQAGGGGSPFGPGGHGLGAHANDRAVVSGGSLGGLTSITRQIQNMMDGLVRSVTAPRIGGGGGGGGRGGGRGGGGGGGGGGGFRANERNFTLSPDQIANIRATLAQPVAELMDAAGEVAARRVAESQQSFDTMLHFYSWGLTRLGASILQDASDADEDPRQALEEMTSLVIEARRLFGLEMTDAAINRFDSLELFRQWMDEMSRLRDLEMNRQDFEFRRETISAAQYREILQGRLQSLEEYTSEWIRLQDQILALDEQIQAEQDAIFRNRFEAGDVSLAEYETFLKKKLNSYEQYSDEWISIWRELQSLQEEEVERSERILQSLESTLTETFNSFMDPITAATDLIGAFGDSTVESMGQLEGFYDHMKEGTQRWVVSLEELRDLGVNNQFLQDLISQGPGSLAFAESLLALGPDAISLINSSMADIAAIAQPAAMDFTEAQIGTLVQNQNNISLTIGSMDLSFDTEGGFVTMADVQAAIQEALSNLGDQIANRTVGSNAG